MKQLRLWATLLTTTLLVGCSSDEQSILTHRDGEVALQLVRARVVGENPATRAEETSLAETEKIGFFVQENSTFYTAKNNLAGSYKEIDPIAQTKAWVPTEVANTIWLNDQPATLAIYHPYDALQTTAQALHLKSAIHTPAADLSAASFTANSSTDMTALAQTLTRVYARLSVIFLKDVLYTGTSELTALQLTGADIFSTATYNPLTKVYTNGTANFTVPAFTKKSLTTVPATTAQFDLLMVPQAVLTNDVTFIVTVDDKEMEITIPKAKFTQALIAGVHQSITITVGPKGLAPGGIKTMDWDKQAMEDLGGLGETKEEWIEIGGTKWAICNVANNKTFADNSWEMGTRYNYADAITACPDGYRLPTKSEFETLYSKMTQDVVVTVILDGTTYTSEYGYISDRSKPCLGVTFRSDGGTIFYIPSQFNGGTEVYYWMYSTPFSESENVYAAVYVNGGSQQWIDDFDLGTSQNPVRCVKK